MVANRSRIAGWGEVTFPVSEDESGARLEDARGLGKAGPLIGDCPNHIDTDCAVDACRVEPGRLETRAFVPAGDAESTRPRSRLFQRNSGKVDANERRAGRARNPLARSAATASEIGDFLAWASVQPAHHLPKFAECYVAVGGFVCRIFVAESLQVK